MFEKTKSFNKLLVVIPILIILSIIIYFVFFNGKEKVLEEVNTEFSLKLEDYVLNNILFDDILIYEEDGQYYIVFRLTNLTANNLAITPITLNILNDSNEKIINIVCYAGERIDPDSNMIIGAETDVNLKDASKIEFAFETQVIS